jgi:EAL domain-containing protein (putative c-di-GMP-specific phosphodiesterase class I)
VVEVTETALMDSQIATTHLEALRHMGVVVSLDDFGTGYHSTAQLTRLPVDVLKIDRNFVDASTAAGRSLLELMVKTAHAFGTRVVAEGVEHQDQLDLVRRLGCEYAQGYYLGMPAPAARMQPVEPDELAG